MEENTTIIEENLESIEEFTTEDIQNDNIPTSTENIEESGEDILTDDTLTDSGILEDVGESAAVPEETDTASDLTEEETTEEFTEIDGEISIEELVSGNEIPQQVFYLMQGEEETTEEVLFLEKPLNEYTTTEGLLMLIFALAFVNLCYTIIFD